VGGGKEKGGGLTPKRHLTEARIAEQRGGEATRREGSGRNDMGHLDSGICEQMQCDPEEQGAQLLEKWEDKGADKERRKKNSGSGNKCLENCSGQVSFIQPSELRGVYGKGTFSVSGEHSSAKRPVRESSKLSGGRVPSGTNHGGTSTREGEWSPRGKGGKGRGACAKERRSPLNLLVPPYALKEKSQEHKKSALLARKKKIKIRKSEKRTTSVGRKIWAR